MEIADPKNMTDAEKRYDKAMKWLLQEDERKDSKGETRSYLRAYIDSQTVYTAAEEKRINQFNEAYDKAVNDTLNNTVAKKRAAYDKWVNENARKLRNQVEGAYKDWVVHGRKEACEYWFSVVDNDSAMARVEDSRVRD